MPVIQLGILFYSVLFLVVPLISGAPDGISKRAQILPPKSNNSSNIQRHADNANNTSGQSVTTASLAGGVKDEICPSHLVAHNVSDVTVCCIPIFNCPVGHGIIPCKKDGEMDSCVPCPQGMLQTNNVSSLNIEEADCYAEKNTENCPLDDTKPSRKYSDVISCLLKCECKNEECWYGKDPCACNLSSPCPINYTMNRETGACEKCPWYAYKSYRGCGTCTVIPELWEKRTSRPPSVEPVHKITSESSVINDDTDGQKEDRKPTPTTRVTFPDLRKNDDPDHIPFPLWAIVLIILVSALVVVVITAAVLMRKNSGSNTQLPLIGNDRNDQNVNFNQQLTALKDNQINATELQVATALKRANTEDLEDGRKMMGKNEENVVLLGAVGGADLVDMQDHIRVDEAEINYFVDDELARKETQKKVSHKQMNMAPKPNRGGYKPADGEPLEHMPLLNEVKLDAKGGAISKHVSGVKNQHLRPKSSSSPIVNKGIIYDNCSFQNCKFSGPQKVSARGFVPLSGDALPLNEDDSLGSNFSTLSLEDDHGRHVLTRLKDTSPTEIAINVNNNNLQCSEHTTVDNNNIDKCTTDRGCEKMDKCVALSKINNMSDSKTSLTKTNNGKQPAQVNSKENEIGERTVDEKNNHLKSAHGREDNINETINLETVSNISDVIKENNISSSLHAIADVHSNNNDNDTENHDDEETEMDNKKPIADVSKFEVTQDNESTKKIDQAVAIKTSPRSSESDSDDMKNGKGEKRKIKPFNSTDNERRPMARIIPIRQTSVQEQTTGTYHNSANRSYQDEPADTISSLASSYVFVHQDGQPDIADLEELGSLNTASIIAEDDLLPRTSEFNSENSDAVLSPLDENQRHVGDPGVPRSGNTQESLSISPTDGQRLEPEGCSVSGTFVQGPDFHRTYCKVVEGTDTRSDEQNNKQPLNEETLVKTPVSDQSNYTETKTVTGQVDRMGGSIESLDEVDEEKKKISKAVTVDNKQVVETSVKVTPLTKISDDKAKEVQKSDSVVETNDSQKVVNIEADSLSDTSSVELPIDCLLDTEDIVEVNNRSDTHSSDIDTNDDSVEIVCDDLTEFEKEES